MLLHKKGAAREGGEEGVDGGRERRTPRGERGGPPEGREGSGSRRESMGRGGGWQEKEDGRRGRGYGRIKSTLSLAFL